MRTQTISFMEVTYPDELVWKNDSTVIEISGSNNTGGQIVVECPTGESHTLEYYSDQNKLLFYLDDAIKALYADNIGPWNCHVTAFDQGIPMGDLYFNFFVLNGKSFITRSHGISSTIYIYNPDELYKVQVFSPQQGQAVCGQYGFNCYYGLNQFNLSSAIHNSGEYQLCLRDSSQVPAMVYVTGATDLTPSSELIHFTIMGAPIVNETHGGDVFSPNKLIYPICHKIIYQDHCDDFAFGEISYTDLDGMRRYLGGKVISDTDEVKTESYITSNTDIYKTTPNRFVSSHSKTIKLGLFDIDKNAYPHDLLYSDDIWYRTWDNEWKPCSLKTTNLVRKNEESYDIDLEIIVSQ